MTLSSAQRGLWALDQLAPGSAFYNVPLAYRLRGPLDAGRLSAAVERVAGRHEVLRTSIVSVEGAPEGIVRPASDFRLGFSDLCDLPEGRREAEALRRALETARRAFDLERDVPFRAELVRLTPADHVLVLTWHHTAADERSARLVVREIVAGYSEGLDALRRPAVQYGDVALRGEASLHGEELDVLLAYWRKTLRDAPASISLPTDRPAPPVPSFKGAVVEVPLPPDLVAGLEAIANARATDLDVTLLAGFEVLLHRYTSQDDLVLGRAVDGRTDETAAVVGTFVNVLPLRVDAAGNPAFGGLVERVRDRMEELEHHRGIPFERLVEELHPRRGSGGAPSFQVVFAVEETADEPPSLGDVTVEEMPLEAATARFDLLLTIAHGRDGVAAYFEFATDLFDAATVRRLARHWVNLLRAAAAAPERRIGGLDLMDSRELEEVVGLGATPGGAARPPVHVTIAGQAEVRPDAPAVVSGEVTISYAGLMARSGAVAAELQRRGVR
ncbi:MAG: condensation domain-containing protein, partial [Actinomycetota bacterium]|nr:condensation domain-containing protein [Actinomycetota bacterium]